MYIWGCIYGRIVPYIDIFSVLEPPVIIIVVCIWRSPAIDCFSIFNVSFFFLYLIACIINPCTFNIKQRSVGYFYAKNQVNICWEVHPQKIE